jgi:hypothetical protein
MSQTGSHPEFERLAEFTLSMSRRYADPFNDVEVDVVFAREGEVWRVPAYWRGGHRWGVRFAPPAGGRYSYTVETTDADDADLNGRAGSVTIKPYRGANPLLRRGNIRVSANGRHFEHADGTPFFWLGEAWYSGLSTRLSWAGFTKLVRDRKAKGFTVGEANVGFAVSNEETAPIDPPFRNEGGPVWDEEFTRINPRYFDYADRRIQHLVEQGLVPVLIGGWGQVLGQMGVAKMRQHWRTIIARYGAYPVIWIVGGEVYDPPADKKREVRLPDGFVHDMSVPGWSDVVRYVRELDPYHHPVSVHEQPPPFDTPLDDDSLTDFDYFQASHMGWPSIPTAIAQLNLHYSRRTVVKPLIMAEIGFERFADAHYEDFQRAAFWLCMLNGAAGFMYSTIETAMFPGADQPFSRVKYSFFTWEEALDFPGSGQIGLGAGLLQSFRWWEFEPRPDWVTPAGTTLLEPHDEVGGFDIDILEAVFWPGSRDELPRGIWNERGGNWRLPYAAGIPGEVRVIYLPYFGYANPAGPLSVLALEPGSRYRASYWKPSLGVRVDLGIVETDAEGSGRVDVSRLDRRVLDAAGGYRGEVSGTVWDEFGTRQKVENGAYTPEKPPTVGDWILLMEALDEP